jgi:CIC family chloride channel protein
MRGRRLRPSRALRSLRRFVRNDQVILTVLALVVGTVSGGAIVVFRETIALVQGLAFGSGTDYLHEHAATLPWWRLLLAPALGGLAVGLFVHFALPGRRPHGVADAIEASALRGGRMALPGGIGAALASAASLGVGASVGREGPAVHLGATLGAWLAARLHLTRPLSRTLLGCGAAAAVAASFNAPIAGALFANEVIVGHYALSAFAPIVMASVTGTMVSRAVYGDFPAFIVEEHAIASAWEFPAFAGLGLAGAVVALLFMRGIPLAERAARRLPGPPWLRPAAGGLVVGLLALAFPHVLGVGYGPTDDALKGVYPLALLVALLAAKLAATVASVGFGFAGGVFSPSLVLGAMMGGAYGAVAANLFPALPGDPAAYTLVGMGTVAAAVLGAPISTILIVFEMTGDYTLTVAAMVAVVIASAIVRQVYGPSIFHVQLAARGLDPTGGFQAALLRQTRVADVMARRAELVTADVALPELRSALQMSASGGLFVLREDGSLLGTVGLADLADVAFDPEVDDLVRAGDVARLHPPVLRPGDDLETALKLMRDTGESHVAVVAEGEPAAFLGAVHERDVLDAWNRALVEARAEEHGH